VTLRRRFPIGAEIQAHGGTHFRVWAPAASTLSVSIEGASAGAPALTSLCREPDGYFSGLVAGAGAGTRYWFRFDDDRLRADPASRFQPDGPHRSSQVIDANAFAWTDADWPGLPDETPIVYELHVGTFTGAGTWAAAREQLTSLKDIGITIIELLPVSTFPGRFGWGYDGVLPFAPVATYGQPDDFRAFVDRAHALKIGVVLDVVYNHFGPDGCYLAEFSPHYFSEVETEWGRAINYDAENNRPVREFATANAAYWIDEFHLDGLRLDATQSLHDKTTPHIIAELSQVARDAAGTRRIWIVGENEPQKSELLRRDGDEGYGLDALWNDDFHHTAMVALTGRREAYYSDYLGSPSEFIASAKHGFLYQGQWYPWQRAPRGTPARGVSPPSFVCFLQNHDQVANSRAGRRLHELTSPSRYRAATALLLLGPWTPMLFQGQEFGASTPFLYFADHGAELAALVNKGRREFLRQFPSLLAWPAGHDMPDPAADDSFRRSQLREDERTGHDEHRHLHADLITLRRETPVLHQVGPFGYDGAVLGPQTFVIRFFGAPGAESSADPGDRLLIINFGIDFIGRPLPEPLLAPPTRSHDWRAAWSSEHPKYGGAGAPPFRATGAWRIAAESALLLEPRLRP